MRLSLAILFFILFSHVAIAGDEEFINDVLRNQQTVILEPGVYMLEDTVRMNPGNTLIGQPGTVLKVSSESSQWFVGNVGIITASGTDNIRIEGIEIDGNCENLPRSYANYKGVHDAERGIIVQGYTNKFLQNVVITDCNIYNCFSDAVHVRFSENIQVSNVFASNCQHSSIYFVCVINGLIENCKVAGITSDCVRIESSRYVKLLYSTLYGYFGQDSNGAYQGGHNLVQVGDQGHSKGAGSDKPIHTENIEIAYNTFSGKHLNTIWIDAAGKKPTTNLWIHDNNFVDMPEIESRGYSVGNPPTMEESEEIFSSIFDILRKAATFTYPKVEADHKAYANVTYQNNEIQPCSLVDVQGENIKLVKFEYNETVTRHFIDRGIWTNASSHVGSSLYIPGHFKADDLKITVYSEAGYQVVEDIRVQETTLEASINPNLFIFLAVLGILVITISRNLRRLS